MNATSASHSSGYALDSAASLSSINIIDILLQAGAKPEYSVALHIAVEASESLGDNRAMIEHLLQVRLEIDEMDGMVRGLYGRGSPLMCAMRMRLFDKLRVLLEHGADPFLKNWRGESPWGEG